MNDETIHRPLNLEILDEYLGELQGYSVEPRRLKYEKGYEEKLSGYSELRVATLDFGEPSAKLVAAKRLRLSEGELERVAVRLTRELRVWAKLRHDHILPLVGYHLSKDYKEALLISDYMGLGDLKQYIAKLKPSLVDRLRLVCDLTKGLEHLHSQDIRHGDLKPSNVLVNPAHRALLGDFGISNIVGVSTGLTTSTELRHTVRYASPEILFGTVIQSLSNDIWSWACLALETMTDKKPFETIIDLHIILAVKDHKLPYDPSPFDYPELNDLLSKCLSFQLIDRPKAGDCLRGIESAMSAPRPLGILQAPIPIQSSEPPPSNPWELLEKFNEFFTKEFQIWLSGRQLTMESSKVKQQKVELYKLFLMVGALGGRHVVSKNEWWGIVDAKIRFAEYGEPDPYPKPQVAKQLSDFYLTVLADFEELWHDSFKRHDPTATFPLPSPLRFLRPNIERLAHLEPPSPLENNGGSGSGAFPTPNRSGRVATADPIAQRTALACSSEIVTGNQDSIIQDQNVLPFSTQLGLRCLQGPGMAGSDVLPPDGALSQAAHNPEALRLVPADLSNGIENLQFTPETQPSSVLEGWELRASLESQPANYSPPHFLADFVGNITQPQYSQQPSHQTSQEQPLQPPPPTQLTVQMFTLLNTATTVSPPPSASSISLNYASTSDPPAAAKVSNNSSIGSTATPRAFESALEGPQDSDNQTEAGRRPKRSRGDDVSGPNGSTIPSGPHKRAKFDPPKDSNMARTLESAGETSELVQPEPYSVYLNGSATA